MRYEGGPGYEIGYPNEMVYAGMPALVEVKRATDYVGVGVLVRVGDEDYVETRSLFNGATTFDISRYMQMAFIGKELGVEYGTNKQANLNNLSQEVEVVISLTNAEGESEDVFTFKTTALYGYNAFGQANGGVRRRTLFANYPQTFDFYCTLDTNFYLDFDNGTTQDVPPVNIDDGIHQASVELSGWWNVPPGVKNAVLRGADVVYLVGDSVVWGESKYQLSVNHSTSGVFLRWLDHFGQWCYYLFRTTAQNYTAKEEHTWQGGELRSGTIPVNGVVQGADFVRQQLSQQHTMTVGAKLVDAETFDLLLSLTNSSRVEMLVNAEEYQDDNTTTPIWERVNIVAGSYARTGAPLQDFVVSIARTAQKTQML